MKLSNTGDKVKKLRILRNIKTHEVSCVDRGANNEEFCIYKRDVPEDEVVEEAKSEEIAKQELSDAKSDKDIDNVEKNEGGDIVSENKEDKTYTDAELAKLETKGEVSEEDATELEKLNEVLDKKAEEKVLAKAKELGIDTENEKAMGELKKMLDNSEPTATTTEKETTLDTPNPVTDGLGITKKDAVSDDRIANLEKSNLELKQVVEDLRSQVPNRRVQVEDVEKRSAEPEKSYIDEMTELTKKYEGRDQNPVQFVYEANEILKKHKSELGKLKLVD